jgi:predicted GIY-YIG superfamily endonuclease
MCLFRSGAPRLVVFARIDALSTGRGLVYINYIHYFYISHSCIYGRALVHSLLKQSSRFQPDLRHSREVLPMAAARHGSRSSLTNHAFPSFYACYLLKSLKTPRATATYIGSTPNPPRRLRQHNGEISAGASKTRNGRPWDMVMIVYGFPSKVSALQFEWAWQHPWRTRHLKTSPGGDGSGRGRAIFPDGRGLWSLNARVNVVRTMITSYPYSNWPLHVKLFSTEAVKAWEESYRTNPYLPMGFTSAIELEGVDGKKADVNVGSGRRGPIDVSDGKLEPVIWSTLSMFLPGSFTSTHLAGARALASGPRTSPCSVCKDPIDIRTTVRPLTSSCRCHPSPTYRIRSQFACARLWHAIHSLISHAYQNTSKLRTLPRLSFLVAVIALHAGLG